MKDDEYRDLEFQVNKVFEDVGGFKLFGPDRDKPIEHLLANPFFIDRDGAVPSHAEKGDGMLVSIRPHFSLGIILGTLSFKSKVEPDEALVSLSRHAIRDWGNLCKEDRDANESALEMGLRIISSYRTRGGADFLIITEKDRSATIALLPEEYKQ